jgi:hypothetical protein
MKKQKVVPPLRRSSRNAYQTFLDALSNPNTRTNYTYFFSQFREALKLSESCNELLEIDGRELEDRIVEYIKDMTKRRGASSAAIKITLTAIRKFFVENREESRLNWSWLKSRIPKGNGTVKDRDYTKVELVRMWEQSDIRKKAILSLLMAGLRKGAIPDLRVGSLEKITRYKDKDGEEQHELEHHLYKLRVYEGSDEEYITFLTPAGAKAVDRYIEARTMAGEKVTANSPLIRDVFDFAKKNAGEPKPVTLDALDMLFMRLTRSAGIRPKEKAGKRQDRHDIMLFHGIRKYVNHSLVNSGCEPIAKELLIGHSPPGLEGSYLRLTENELLIQFLKAVPMLSLSQEHELKQQVDELRIEVADLNVLKAAYNELKAEKEQDEGHVAMLQEALEEERKERQEDKQRNDEKIQQIAEAFEETREAFAQLRDTMEKKQLLREREKKE